MKTARIKKAIDYLYNNKAEHAYHNNEHMLLVYHNVERITNSLPDMSYTGKELLCIAALFHDFNHSGGKLTDAENIKIAVEAFKEYVSTKDDYYSIRDVSFVVKLIEATQFPHITTVATENIFTDVIQDADVLASIEHRWIFVMLKLAEEFNMTIEQMIPMQLKFHQNVKFKTKFAQRIQRENQGTIVRVLTMLEDWYRFKKEGNKNRMTEVKNNIRAISSGKFWNVDVETLFLEDEITNN